MINLKDLVFSVIQKGTYMREIGMKMKNVEWPNTKQGTGTLMWETFYTMKCKERFGIFLNSGTTDLF